MVKRKIRCQRPIKGEPRIPTSTSVSKELEAWVRREARIYGCSRAFVRANCISFASGIPMESYRQGRRRGPLTLVRYRKTGT